MLKRVHGWLLATGIILILAGVAVLIRLDAADSASAQNARPQIVQAVVDLQGCFCHDSAAETALLVRHADETALMVANLPLRSERTPDSAVATRLVSAGQRILALPATTDRQQAEAVISSFLLITDQMRLAGLASGSPASEKLASGDSGTLAALEQLEFWLSLLENQTSPTRWSRANSLPQPPDQPAWQTVSLVSRDTSAAFEFIVPVLDVTRQFVCLSDDHRAVLRAGAGFGIHRRGPPAGAPTVLV